MRMRFGRGVRGWKKTIKKRPSQPPPNMGEELEILSTSLFFYPTKTSSGEDESLVFCFLKFVEFEG